MASRVKRKDILCIRNAVVNYRITIVHVLLYSALYAIYLIPYISADVKIRDNLWELRFMLGARCLK